MNVIVNGWISLAWSRMYVCQSNGCKYENLLEVWVGRRVSSESLSRKERPRHLQCNISKLHTTGQQSNPRLTDTDAVEDRCVMIQAKWPWITLHTGIPLLLPQRRRRHISVGRWTPRAGGKCCTVCKNDVLYISVSVTHTQKNVFS